jgi:hypothetical protein
MEGLAGKHECKTEEPSIWKKKNGKLDIVQGCVFRKKKLINS